MTERSSVFPHHTIDRVGGYASALDALLAVMPQRPCVCLKYLPEVAKGDKRIILVDGEFAGAVNRVPQ